jgi:phosphate transport system permease protein
MTDNFLVRRHRANRIMLSLTGACTVISLSVLFVVLGYITWKGGSSLNWDFITNLPKPVGETGGGIVNAIIGSAKIVGLAACFGVPIGVLGAVYLAEYGGTRMAF